MPRKVVPRIVAAMPAEQPVTLHVRWDTGEESVIDLAGMVDSYRTYAPLRESPELFRNVRVGEYGTDVAWTDEIDMAADTLWRLAQEQAGETMTPEAFRHWRQRKAYTLDEAAHALGLSRRMVAYYEKGTVRSHVWWLWRPAGWRWRRPQIEPLGHEDCWIEMSKLYDKDVLLWSERQAMLLRRRAAGQLVNDAEFDWPNIAEEIESVGISERRALAGTVRNILEHLIKLEASPASMPRAGWRATIARGRIEIAGLLKESPSLGPNLDAVILDELSGARSVATIALSEYGETPRVPIEELSYSRDQVLGPWFPPESR